MRAMKVAVAFQMMAHTVGMSCSDTTPNTRASKAPSVALQPTPSPLGCQTTRIRVNRKIRAAGSMETLSRLMGRAEVTVHGLATHRKSSGANM
ncbi:hypothetical protein D3C73_1250790 [compost metagenome]